MLTWTERELEYENDIGGAYLAPPMSFQGGYAPGGVTVSVYRMVISRLETEVDSSGEMSVLDVA